MQMGIPVRDNFMSGFLPPLGFLAITGLAFSFLTINSIIWDESKAESPITAFIGDLKVFLTYLILLS